MTKKVISIDRTSPIKNLFRIFDQHGIMGVPVIKKDRTVVGVITEGDLLEHLTTLKSPKAVTVLGSLLYLDDLHNFNTALKKHCAETVEGLMSQPAITLTTSKTLQDTIDLMAKSGVHRLPVVDNQDKLVGIVTRSDVVHQLAKLKAL